MSALNVRLPHNGRLPEGCLKLLLPGCGYLLLVALLQFAIPVPLDADTAYHAAVAQLIRDHGLLYAFPWTPFSWLADNYADKELLFHLLFVPFMGLGWLTAAKIVGTLCGAAILTAMYAVLRKEAVLWPFLWGLITLAASHSFLYRFSIVRPHLFSIALALIVLWAAARGRLLLLAAAAAIYPWAYVAWHLPLILVAIAETARLLSRCPVRWKPLVAAAGGIAAGVALHPNSLNLLRLFWIQIVDVLFRTAWGAREGFDLGLEFLPETAEGWARGLAVCVLLLIYALVLAWRERRTDALPLAFGLTALAFGCMTAKTARFTEYFVPFSVAAMALSARHVPWRYLPHGILCVALLYTTTLNARFLLAFGRSPDTLPQSAASFLQGRIPPGAQVFTPDWASTGVLMLALPERRFIVGLDPTFFYLKDPEKYRLWYRLAHEAPPDLPAIIRQQFNSRYVVCFHPEKIFPQQWSPFLERLSSAPGVRLYDIEGLWLLFDLGGGG